MQDWQKGALSWEQGPAAPSKLSSRGSQLAAPAFSSKIREKEVKMLIEAHHLSGTEFPEAF